MPRLLLTGTYRSKNKGDAALFLAMAAEARRQMPGLSVSLGLPFPHLDRPLYEPLGVGVVASHRRKLGRCLLQMSLGGWVRPWAPGSGTRISSRLPRPTWSSI